MMLLAFWGLLGLPCWTRCVLRGPLLPFLKGLCGVGWGPLS